MPLRGTVNKKEMHRVLNARPTLQNQITALKAQVNRQKPETQYFRVSGSHSNTGGTIEQNNHLITSSLISSTNFRQNVTGDQWTNIALNLKIALLKECRGARVILYVPKKAGTRFTPGSSQLVEQIDPSSFWVISDTFMNQQTEANLSNHSRRFNLKKMKTIYDSNVASIEKGELVLSVIYYPRSASVNTQYSYGYELVYNNV
uniref:Uncharacterized protein n=1 Tax=uncultured marine virus TaxID=186617 RepID=S4TDV9_9VIRU|nr:hypothetical protein [uncultured marine virus]